MSDVTFYFDLGSPYGYLASERVETLLPESVRWQPVLLGGLFKHSGRSSWSLGDESRRRAGMQEVERRAQAYGLAPVRWPEPWPSDYLHAMRAATFAFTAGVGCEFARRAYRDAFQRGADLGEPENVVRVGAAVGLDATALTEAMSAADVRATLRAATDAAFERGVTGVPTLSVDGELFWGDDRLEDAAAHLRATSA